MLSAQMYAETVFKYLIGHLILTADIESSVSQNVFRFRIQ